MNLGRREHDCILCLKFYNIPILIRVPNTILIQWARKEEDHETKRITFHCTFCATHASHFYLFLSKKKFPLCRFLPIFFHFWSCCSSLYHSKRHIICCVIRCMNNYVKQNRKVFSYFRREFIIKWAFQPHRIGTITERTDLVRWDESMRINNIITNEVPWCDDVVHILK